MDTVRPCACAEALTAKARGMPIIRTLGCVASSNARKMGGICVRPCPATSPVPASNGIATYEHKAVSSKRKH